MITVLERRKKSAKALEAPVQECKGHRFKITQKISTAFLDLLKKL